MTRLYSQIPDNDSAAAPDRDLATLILTLLSVAEDDRTLSQSLSMVRAETSSEDFACGMQEAARRIGVLFGAAQRLEVTERSSINRLPV
ncbi:hypothetical protein NUH88_21215 [Nisaea acidiphila]|uniref:Uncharacterized protein n=1 Tax=Nisaea acidiphila TaxID=1862145 RepID=A0A9J7ARL8_9PROT|nr:hypothetical protein [Nisaea acidiphila]UUX49895.1 hypothetical protein NUH88_21215 [Nisaea acidiphila]